MRSILVLFFILSLGLRGQKPQEIYPTQTEIEVLKEIIGDSIPMIYYKTIVTNRNEPISSYLPGLSNFDLCVTMAALDSMKLDEKDRKYLTERFSKMKEINMRKIISGSKEHTLKKLKGYHWSVVSLPVVFREGNLALYFRAGSYGGGFSLLKKKNGRWTRLCYYNVWLGS